MSNYLLRRSLSPFLIRSTMSGISLCTLLFCTFALSLTAQDSRQLTRDESTKRSDSRIALVIGNGAYEHTSKLDNPVNDATDMAQALKDLGFEVISGTNQNKLQMRNLIREFGNRLADTKGTGLFYYAGHGLAANGDNYLVPVDADIKAEDEIEDLSVSMNFLLGKMAAAQNGFNMVILDACRNNPFARSWRSYRDIGDKGGLTRVKAPTGTLIAYATKPGDVAADGKGRNGLYTAALLKQMRVKDVDVTKMLQSVRAEVLKNSDNKQVPFDESSLVGDFYFAGKGGDAVTNTNPDPMPAKTDRIEGERAFWESIKNSTDPEDFEFYLKKYPDGEFAPVAENNLRRLIKAKTASEKKEDNKLPTKPETSVEPTLEVNVALGKPATQSSDIGPPYEATDGVASLAVDGNTNGDWFGESVTHTNDAGSSNPWWQVDLGADYNINKIQIWNRTDGSQDRLNKYQIWTKSATGGREEFSPGLKTYMPGETYPRTFTDSKKARFVIIQINDPNAILSLAEVKVFGTPFGKTQTP